MFSILTLKNKLWIYPLIILGLLNRYRGTWGWWAKVNAAIYATVVYFMYRNSIDSIVITHMYGLYTKLLVLISNSLDVVILAPSLAVFGITVVVTMCFFGYVIGEMVGWGLGVGTVSEQREAAFYLHNEREYGWYTGIQKLAEYLIPPTQENWVDHCRLALFLRGLWYFSWMLFPLMFTSITVGAVVNATLLLAIMFPIACDLGYIMAKKFKLPYLDLIAGWTWQEIIYGAV